VCGSCGACEGATLRCGRGKVTLYCSKACQQQHWPLHKAFCSAGAVVSIRGASLQCDTRCAVQSRCDCVEVAVTTPLRRLAGWLAGTRTRGCWLYVVPRAVQLA
jgi:hypothetical protein